MFKVYSIVSGRRFIGDLSEAWERNYITKLPHYNSVFNYLEASELTPILHALITQSSLPLKAIENDFAVDSSGFSMSGSVTWFNTRYGHEQDNRDWLKLHLMCGVKTNVVTSVEITGRNAHDAPQMPALVEGTAQNFTLREVSADKGYSSRTNLDVIIGNGGMPYIAFKERALIQGEHPWSVWTQMWHYYNFRRDTFLEHYHKRSNIESTFSMLKAKFGSSIRSKTLTAQVNELLCKVLCHNICVLIASIFELNLEPTFWKE